MPHSTVYQDKILDACYGANHSSVFPNTMWVALYYEAPTQEGGGTEADYEEYDRVEIDNDGTMFDDAVDGEKLNLLQIDFPTPWGSDFNGIWSSGGVYAAGEIVAYGEDRYVALGVTTGDQPDESPTDWELMVPPDPIVAFALHDHATNDSVVAFEDLSDPIQVLAGEPLYIPEEALVLTPALGE